jgi:folate-binding protein YgfZ
MSAPFRLDRSVIHVSGPDLDAFLQNLLTQDALLQQGEARYAALLTPQGKVVADMIIFGAGPGVLMDVDPARAETLKRLLNLYKLRAQVSIVDLSENTTTIVGHSHFDGAIADPRLPGLGFRKIVQREEAASLVNGAAAYEQRRIALGVPDLARDAAPEEVFALEALLEELNGVDFQKGCFVGQENVSRMKRRATTRKKFCPVVFEGDPPPYGAPVRAGEAELGSIRSSMPGRAIALIRLDRALGARDKGEPLRAGDKRVQLDPPDWLLLPARDD